MTNPTHDNYQDAESDGLCCDGVYWFRGTVTVGYVNGGIREQNDIEAVVEASDTQEGICFSMECLPDRYFYLWQNRLIGEWRRIN